MLIIQQIQPRFISLSNSTPHPVAGPFLSAATIPSNNMDKSTPNRFAEPKIIGTEAEARQYANRMGAAQSASNNEPKTKKFDPEKYFQEELEKSQAEKERRLELEATLKEYSLPWDFRSKTSPFPGMVLNPCFVRWEPENIEDFIREHGEEFKKYKSAGLTNQSGKQSSEKSLQSDSGQSTIMTKVESVPNPEHPKSEKPPKNEAKTKPNVIPKKTAPPKVKEKIKTAGTPPEVSTKEVETLPEVITVTESTIMTEPDKGESRQKRQTPQPRPKPPASVPRCAVHRDRNFTMLIWSRPIPREASR